MADDYDYDVDDGYDYDDDGWMYVEDEYGLVDELADMAIAEPGYAGTNHEIASESYEYDMFDYWDDIEYADDAYWESEGRILSQRKTSTDESAGLKRKRGGPAKSALPDKRRKGNTTDNATGAAAARGQDVVLYMTQERQCHASLRRPPMLENEGSYAFIPDWQQRYAAVDGQILRTEMPFDMQKAAKAQENPTPEKARKYVRAGAHEMGEEEFEDDEDEDEEEEEEEGGSDSELPSLAPEILEQVLKQKLAESGLVDPETEAALLQALQKMLTSGGNEEDVDMDGTASDLARLLLSNTSRERGGGLVSWLENMGVDINAVEDSDIAEETDLMDSPPVSSGAGRHGPQASPSDSAIAGVSLPGKEPARRSVKFAPSSTVQSDISTPSMSGEMSTTQRSADGDDARKEKNFRSEEGKAKTISHDREVHEYAPPRPGESDVQHSDPRPAARGSQRRKRKATTEEVDLENGPPNGSSERVVKKPATARNRSARSAASG